MVYDRVTHAITQRRYSGYWNMKQAMQGLAKGIYDGVVKPERDEAYLFLVRETVPFYCSEGELKEPLCQRMIGYALTVKWLLPDKSMVNRYLSSASRHYKFVAYLKKEDDTIVRMNLTKNHAQSVAQFKAFVEPEDSDYKAGIIGHTAQNNYWNWHSALVGADKKQDCYEILTRYAQKELKLYEKSGTDEKAAKVLVKEKMDEKHKSALKKMREIYTGKGEKLYKAYIFYATVYDKNNHRIYQRARGSHWTMKAAMNALITDVYNHYVRYHKEIAYAFFVHEKNPFYCSEGDLDKVFCKRMIGYALRHNWQRAHKKMIDKYISSKDNDYQYIAYVKDDRKKDSEVKRVNLTSNWGAAVAKYNQLIKGNSKEYTVGVVSHTQQQNWWYPMTQKTGNMKYMDTYELLADYCQKKLEVWKDSGVNEKDAKLKTKEEWDAELKEADERLKGIFKGTGDTLYKQYTFSTTLYNRRSHYMTMPFNKNMWSMRNALIEMTRLVYQRVYRAEQDYAWMFTVK